MSRGEERDKRTDDSSTSNSSSSSTFASFDDRGRGRGRGSDDDSSFDDSYGFNSGGNTSRWDDSSEDPITRMSSRGQDGSRRGYRFQADDDGVVTSLKRIRGNRVKNKKIEAGETWLFDRSTRALIHREFGDAGTEIKTYTDNDGDGIFTRAFQTMSPFASSVMDGF